VNTLVIFEFLSARLPEPTGKKLREAPYLRQFDGSENFLVRNETFSKILSQTLQTVPLQRRRGAACFFISAGCAMHPMRTCPDNLQLING
jgi:hypothetical protein